jgi:uncharacterized surface protein with fasciclin (FAS1) repeats
LSQGTKISNVAPSRTSNGAASPPDGVLHLKLTVKSEELIAVCAPKDEAFAAPPADTVDTLMLEENGDQLTEVLTAHVAPRRLKAADLLSGRSMGETPKPTTASGDALSVGF